MSDQLIFILQVWVVRFELNTYNPGNDPAKIIYNLYAHNNVLNNNANAFFSLDTTPDTTCMRQE